MLLGYFEHKLEPFVIKFPDGWAIPGIRWYGIAYLIGFFGAFLILYIFRKKHVIKINDDESQHFLIYLLMSILVGGRLGYVFLYDFEFFIKNPVHIFYFWNGGMASHGGFIGAIGFLLLFKRRFNYSVLSSADLVVALVPIGLFFGRIANFINCEVVGRITDVKWAVIFSRTGMLEPRHPSQLYEALLEGFLLFIYTQYRIWNTNIVKKFQGHLACEFTVLYCILRIFVEFFREPDAPLILGITRGQFYSLVLLTFALLSLIFTRRSGAVSGKNIFYESCN